MSDQWRDRLRGRSELLVAVFLASLGVLVVTDAVRMSTDFTQRGPVGPRVLPTMVGIALIAVALLLAVLVWRGSHGEAGNGEDVDPTMRSDWRTLAILVGVLLANAALIDTLGWPISGALLFWGSVYALGSRHYLRDALIALGLAALSFVGLARLGVMLPGGPLEGLLTWTP